MMRQSRCTDARPVVKKKAFIEGALGLSISKRQVIRLLIERQTISAAKAAMCCGQDWAAQPGSGRRHRRAARRPNGFCTQIGNDDFTWFGTRASKSRLNFLDLLRAGHTDYVINAAAGLHALPLACRPGVQPWPPRRDVLRRP